MKTTPKMRSYMLLGIILMSAGTFHKAFGIPDGFVMVLMILSLLCWLVFFREMKKSKDSISKTTPPPLPVSPRAHRRNVILIFSLLIISCATFPLLNRFTGINIPFSTMVFSSCMTFILCSIIILIKLSKKQ